MKILIMCWRCIKNPAAGGSELYFHEIAKRWAVKGHKVVWFSPMFPGALKKEKLDGIEIIRAGNRITVYPLAMLNYFFKTERDFDVIIDVENGFPFFSPMYAKNKVVLHMHHLHKEVWFKEKRPPLSWVGYFLEMKAMPIVYRKNKIIAVSKSSADELVENGIAKERPFVVNPGIEFYKYKKLQRSKKPCFLFLNRIKKYKGIDTFLKAANELSDKNIDFLIVGSDGDYADEMKKYMKKNKLSNVKYLGKVSEKKKTELMQKAWAFVNPSFKEGWGIVNIEANYFGTPVIGSDVAGIRDSVIDKKTGLLFKYGDYKELADKILEITEDKKKLDLLGKEAKKWSKGFSWDNKAGEYMKCLEKITNSSGK